MKPRGRGGLTTAALAFVLLALSAVVLGGTWQTRQAGVRQAEALETARSLQSVQFQVSVEMLYLRQYRLEPSAAVRQRFVEAADTAEALLTELSGDGDAGVREAGAPLLSQQVQFREVADELLDAVETGDAESRQMDLVKVTPAYYTLQQDVDRANDAYRSDAESQLEQMQSQLTRALVGTTVGLALALALLAAIYRSVLGYQRSLVNVAADNERRALQDPLTGLANRAALGLVLQSLSDAGDDARPCAALVVDLDGFKGVNDSLGHQAGDDLLVEVAGRVSALLRAGDIVSRTGGDEFVIVLKDVDVEAATAVARRTLAAVQTPVQLGTRQVSVGASIGVAVAPLHCSTEALIVSADNAMYRAKKRRSGIAVYDVGTDGVDASEVTLLHELTQLLATGDPAGELQLHYQPQLDLTSLRVHGVEALLRWQHPARGMLAPDVVLPLVDKAGLDVELTNLVLDRALRQAVAWRDAGNALRVAVNVSPECLSSDTFVDQVRQGLTRHGVDGTLLVVELLETAVVTEPQRCAEVVRTLRSLDVSVSLDDFGTGFSSLSHLNALDVDEIKIDREFVADLLGSGDNLVLRLAARLGHEMGVRVVAEGVEDVAILPTLRELGCTDVQGFAVSRPVPAGDVLTRCRVAEELVRTSGPLAGAHT